MTRDCVVVGGGLAGAAVAASLARRGWEVTVLDAAVEPAAGASALPVGLLAPHYSADDNLLSQLTRCGVALTLSEARARLRDGVDWAPSGALQHRVGESMQRVIDDPAMRPWARAASDSQKLAAGLAITVSALWHQNAAWIRPGALVRSWLGESGVTWRGASHVASIRRNEGRWSVLDSRGAVIASASLLVIAAAHASAALLGGRIPLHPVRGQISWGLQNSSMAMPAFPVNGNGHFIPGVPHGEGLAWYSGSTYDRGDVDHAPRERDHAANLQRLGGLLPAVASQLAPAFDRGEIHAWSGVRCASSDRRPLVGELEPGLWLSTAMGSRGLTFSPLCAELLAARVSGEALPLEVRLASALDVARLIR